MYDYIRYHSAKETDAYHNIKNFKVIGYCCKCKSSIDLRWNDNLVLVGRFRAKHKYYSDLWNTYLPNLDEMICERCM
jgi:hypothetical protein